MRTLTGMVLLLMPVSALAQSAGELTAKAEQEFRHGLQSRSHLLQARKHFSESADAYLKLHEQGIRSAGLYLSLGNAAALADRWTLALWAYEMGLKLDPNDRRLREHRDFLRTHRVVYPSGKQGQPESDAWPAWLYRPSLTVLGAVAAALYVLGWTLATAGHLRRRPGLYFWALIAFLMLAVASGALWYGVEQAETDRQTPLVVLLDNTPLYRGNGKHYATHSDQAWLSRGMEARQLHRRGGWLQIRLSSGEVGWVPLSAVGVVAP